MLQKLLITFALATVALGGLTVWQPSDLASGMKNVSFVIANMGKYQYGKTLQGKVFMGTPKDPKEAQELVNGCDAMKAVQGDAKGGNAVFLYVKAGGCDYMTKTRYAEIAGAALLIIQHDDDSLDSIFSDSGAASYGIPAIIVNQTAGNKLAGALAKKDNHIIVAVHFSVPQANKVVYELWMSSSLETAYTFLEKFQKMHNLFEDKIRIQPHYVLWYCFHCRLSNFEDVSNINCISGGRFCAPDPDATGPMSGQEVVMEDLRQQCIYNITYDYYPEKWWGYMTNYRTTCLENQTITEECSNAIMKQQSISAWDVDDCVISSFGKPKKDLKINKDDNEVLGYERELFMQKRIGFWPALIVNNMTYKGTFDNVLEVFDTICAGFYSRPDICDLFYEPNPEDHPSNILIIIIVVLVLLGFFFFMIVVYRRMIKRELTMQMESQISTIVSQYYSMPAEGKNLPGMAKKEDY